MEPEGAAARYCEQCGRRASAEARFCGSCGHRMGTEDDDGAPAAPSGPGPVRERRPREAAPPGDEKDLLEFRPLAVTTFLHFAMCIVTLGIGWLVLRLRRLRSSYRITTQRIELSDGFLSVTRRSVELFRVQDFEVREPLFLRLRGSGDVLVRSMDPGEPVVMLAAVPNVQQVHDTLRRLVAEERKRTHVRTVEDGDDD